ASRPPAAGRPPRLPGNRAGSGARRSAPGAGLPRSSRWRRGAPAAAPAPPASRLASSQAGRPAPRGTGRPAHRWRWGSVHLHLVDLRPLQPAAEIDVDGLPLAVDLQRRGAGLAVAVARGLGAAEGQVYL